MAESWTGDLGSEAGAGFAGAGAALGAVKQQNEGLQQQVASGQLRMNPESAHKAAAVYKEKAAKVRRLARKAERLDSIHGLGNYPSANQLADKFGKKATNGKSGAADLLMKLATELKSKAELFEQAAKDYVATDERNAEDLQRGMRQ